MTRLPRQLESLARMLTYILCHRPDEFGLVLSEEGFILLKHLLQTLVAEPGWGFVRRHHLDQLVGLISPPAFEIVAEQIRALTPEPARLRREPGEPPPALLYVAIPPKVHPKVWEEGLKTPPDRDLVLTTTKDAAVKLGRRRAPHPILVIVQAQAADRRGLRFIGYGEGLYLAPALPRDLLQLPPHPRPRRNQTRKKSSLPPPAPLPWTCPACSPPRPNLSAPARRPSPPGRPAPGLCEKSAAGEKNEARENRLNGWMSLICLILIPLDFCPFRLSLLIFTLTASSS